MATVDIVYWLPIGGPVAQGEELNPWSLGQKLTPQPYATKSWCGCHQTKVIITIHYYYCCCSYYHYYYYISRQSIPRAGLPGFCRELVCGPEYQWTVRVHRVNRRSSTIKHNDASTDRIMPIIIELCTSQIRTDSVVFLRHCWLYKFTK